MAKTILVSDPNRDGESEHSVLCERHLAEALRQAPLGACEYLVQADADADCDGCASA